MKNLKRGSTIVLVDDVLIVSDFMVTSDPWQKCQHLFGRKKENGCCFQLEVKGAVDIDCILG